MAILRPDFIQRPFAANGDKANIPDQPGAQGRASMADGFPVETQTPISAGGIPPSRLDFNGAFNRGGSQFDFWAQSGGMFPWSADLDYALPCLVVGSNGIFYQGKLESGPGTSAGAKDPTAAGNTAYWEVLPTNARITNIENSYTGPPSNTFIVVPWTGGAGVVGVNNRMPYTPPADGWIAANGASVSAGNTSIYLGDTVNGLGNNTIVYNDAAGNLSINVALRVRGGQATTINAFSCNITSIRFIPSVKITS